MQSIDETRQCQEPIIVTVLCLNEILSERNDFFAVGNYSH